MPELTLEQRLSELESVEEIKRLKFQYAAYCDANYDPAGIASLFSEDAVWEEASSGRFEGREAIARFFVEVPKTVRFAAHLMLNPLITVDGERASGTWWLLMPCTVTHEGAEPRGHWHLARYEDDYERVGGQWLFKHVRVIHAFFTPNGEDWASETTSGRPRRFPRR